MFMENNKLSDVNSKSGSELIAIAHGIAANFESPATELLRELANRLECSIIRGDELQQKLDAMAAENAALKQVFVMKEFSTEVTDVFSDTAVLKIDGDEHHCHQWVDNDSDVIRAVLTSIKSENPTPATDAYLNSVRAEGAQMCIDALVKSDDDDFIDAPNICSAVMHALRSGTHDTADKAG